MSEEPTESDLDALMARLADGYRVAYDPLFRALYPRAVRLARYKLEPALASDAAQSAMLKVFARASEFAPGSPVLPWFYAIVANEIHSIARRNAISRVRVATENEAHRIASDTDPERELMQRELLRALDLALEALDGPGAAAIHSMLGYGERPAVESPTFRKRVSRAYARLRWLLAGGFHGK